MTDLLNEQSSKFADSFIVTNGDFNHAFLDHTLPYFQHVNRPTRGDAVIDLCYTNVKCSYKCETLPPLGVSDHDTIYLLPDYITKRQQTCPTTRTISVLDERACERLIDCFECTEWQVFVDACDSLDELNEHVTDYIKFCQSNCSVEKNIKVYGNTKPWINKELKELIIQKHKAHKNKDKIKEKSVQKELENKITASKHVLKNKVESKFKLLDSKGMWKDLKSMAGLNSKQKDIQVEKGKENKYAEELNSFYARFDCHNFSGEITDLQNTLKENNDTAFEIKQHEVQKSFSKLKPNKACGPDGLSPKILKICSKELSYIYSIIFNMSLKLCKIPTIWKTSKIIPVPKSNSVKQMNDLRPVALTSVAMKCMEKIVLNNIMPICQPHLDPFQFAYKSKRSVEDAILFFTNNIYKHLDTPKCYVRTLFIDFSSAFNTIQPHLLIPKLIDFGIPNSISLWILDFLIERPQFVFLKLSNSNFQSSTLITNTGAPQGTVLAPILFSIYTNDCTANYDNIPIIRYADDTSIQALVKNDNDLLNYRTEISRFVQWCDVHFLLLNVKKTKELIIDFRQKNNTHEEIIIKGEQVERVQEYKYLGVIFDENLDWCKNSESLQKKVNQRLYFMKKLNTFKIDVTLLKLFFESCVMSLFYFCITAWGGNVRFKERQSMNRSIKYCYKIFKNTNVVNVEDILKIASKRKIKSILGDDTHPLFKYLQFSVRSGRLIHLKTKTSRHLNSFLPYAIRNHT